MADDYPIVFVHGAGGGPWEWRFWREIFDRNDWRVSAVQLSPATFGLAETSFDTYLKQLVTLLEGSPARSPVLIGASMGGLLALKAASSVRASALVLVNSVPPLGNPHWPPRKVVFPDIITWGSRNTSDSTQRAMPDADDETVSWVSRQWRDESGLVMREMYAGLACDIPDAPCLVVLGGNDEEVPAEAGAALAQQLNADLLRFDGVSHIGALLGARAPLIAEMVCTWLAGTLPINDGLAIE